MKTIGPPNNETSIERRAGRRRVAEFAAHTSQDMRTIARKAPSPLQAPVMSSIGVLSRFARIEWPCMLGPAASFDVEAGHPMIESVL